MITEAELEHHELKCAWLKPYPAGTRLALQEFTLRLIYAYRKLQKSTRKVKRKQN